MSTIGRVLHACCPTRVFVVFFVVAISSMPAVPARAQTSDTTTSADTAAKPDSAKPAAAPNGICLNCGPGDNPPTVSIAPVAGTFGTGTQTVTVDWCDDNGLAAATRAITLNGVDITTEFTYVTVTPSSCGDEAKSVGTLTLHAGANTLAAQINDGAAQLGSATATYTYTQLVIVTPDSAPLTGYAKVADTALFTVKNPTATSRTYTLSLTCPTGWSCMGAPGSVTLNAGVSTVVTVLYTPVRSGTTGKVVLTATPTTSPSSADQGSFTVNVPVTVVVTSVAGIDQIGYWGIAGQALFTITNTGPTQTTFSLSQHCIGTEVTSCTVSPTMTVPVGAAMLATVGYTPGDSNQAGPVQLTAMGSDSGNAASGTVELTIKGSVTTCDTTTFNCSDRGDRTPPVIAVRPSTLTLTIRTATTLVDWCDNDLLQSTYVVTLDGMEISPPLPDFSLNTAPTCVGAGRHSPGVLTLLPGANALEAIRCDRSGNCGSSDALYTYKVLDISTADSALLRRGAGSTFTQAFRVTNIGHEPYVFTLTGSCTGPGVSATGCAIVGATADTLAPGTSQIDTVTYQTPSTAAGQLGTVSIVVSPVLNPGWSASGSVTVRTVPPIVALAATPDSVRVPVAATLSNAYDFWVRNAGNVRDVVTFSYVCTGTGVTSCPTASAPATLPPSDSARIHATFTAGLTGSSGAILLKATSGTTTDTATILVQSQPKDKPVASLDSVWAPGRLERSLCVTVAIGTDGTADECGDLRLAVATSAVRTLGETRAPTLLYGSGDATASVVMPVSVGFLTQATVPDSVTAALLIGGVTRDQGMWPKAQWAAGTGRQIALAIDGRMLTGGPGGANDHSGVYTATLQITSFTGATTLVDTLSTTIAVVDRSQSAFGAGWWLAGLEKLYFPTDGTLTWVGGDGSLRTYSKDPAHTTVYRATSLTRLDSLVKDAGGQFIRYLPNKLHVRFNTAGQHVATITRLGDSTVFAYNASGQLSSITVAPVSAAKTYSFFYDASGRLDSVSAPLGGANGTTRRTTKLAPVGTTRQVGSVTFADSSIIRLTYDPAHVGRLITATDPRSTTTTFAFDGAGKLASAVIGMKGVVPDLMTRITASASQGIHGAAAVDTAVVATRIDGPRTDVGDTTVIRVTPYGAPRRTTDALGHATRLDYRNASFPALVTHVHRLDAAASIATYDPKGHLIAVTDSTTYVDDALGARSYATTTYQWDAIWDEVTAITPPLHDSTIMTYDPTTGNRRTQRDVAGDTVFFGYNTSGRLVSVRDTTHARADSLTYDALGNVASTITPLGYVTQSLRDATGRDTLVTAPIDSGQTVFTTSRTVYDLADRPTLTQTFGPKVLYLKARLVPDSTSPETLTVATVYDSGGLVRRVIRKARPDLAHLDSLVTRMGYDPAGHKVADTATDGAVDTYHYDAAGHVIEQDTRNGKSVTWQYDALGELLARQMIGRTPDSVTFDSQFEAWAPSDFADGDGDFSSFTYDSAGRMRSADNDAALIHRSYAPNGALLTDSLSIGTWAEDDYTRHVYVLVHGYDLDGRRRTTRGMGGDSIDYEAAGRVTGIRDQAGRWFHYQYDRMGRPDTVTDPNGAQLTSTYDAQDRLIRRREIGPGPKDSVLHDDALSYDARGKVLHSLGMIEEDYEGYSALGTLWASMRENTAIGAALQNDERFAADAMGNVVWRTVVRNGGSVGRDSTSNTYALLTGRLTGQASGSLDTTAINYTAGGDRKYVSGLSPGGRTESQYYYRADGLLIAVDNRNCAAAVCTPVGQFPPQSLHGAFEDYRYDALGRRVLVRTRKDHVCEGANCESSMMWVVFDGSAIAAEIRGPGRDSLAVDTLEAGAGNGPMYGTVDYLNGPTLDEPLEIQGIQPYRTWRGLIDGGECLSQPCGTGTIDYPGFTYEAYLSVRPSTQGAPTSWHGSLFAEGQDEGGLMYRRNRYYDPNTGQFTQEDPLGLGGGMNVYGFANGDPVNFADPFGLFDCHKVECPKSADEVATMKYVRQVAHDLLVASKADGGREYGAHIVRTKSGKLRTIDVTRGEISHVSLPPAPDNTVIEIHTHPDQPLPDASPLTFDFPSGPDAARANSFHVYGVVVSPRYLMVVPVDQFTYKCYPAGCPSP